MTRSKTWQKVSQSLTKTGEDRTLGLKLFREFTRSGSLSMSPAERITVSSGAIADFYRRLSLVRSDVSPVIRRKDERWLRSEDFHFVDLRDYGTFFRVLLEIPRLRGSSIVFLPFTDNRPEFRRYPRSHAQIHKGFSDPFLEGCGLNPAEQARLLISTVHLCGKTAGYLLSPLIDPESAVIYRKPEFFAWKQKGAPQGSAETIAPKVRAIVEKEFESSQTYNYPWLRGVLSRAGFYIGDENHSFANDFGSRAVPFNFQEAGALDYFSNIATLLQRDYHLDFFYLPFPEDMKKEEGELLLSKLRKNPDRREYTGWLSGGSTEFFSSLPPELEPVVQVEEDTPLPLLREESIHSWFHDLGALFEKNQGKKIPVSRAFWLPMEGLDTPQEPCILQSLFLNRFSGLGLFRRPLALKGNPGAFSKVSSRLEDVYQRYREVLERGKLIQVVADESYVWWLIREKGRLLIPLLSLNSPEGKNPGKIRIDYGDITGMNKIFSVIDYDFTSSRGSLFLSANNSLEIRDLKPGSFRLFSLQ